MLELEQLGDISIILNNQLMKSSFESNNVGYTTLVMTTEEACKAVYHLVVLIIDQDVLRFTDSRHCDMKLSMTERIVTSLPLSTQAPPSLSAHRLLPPSQHTGSSLPLVT